MQKNIPTVGAYLDDEEKELIEAIEGGEYDIGESLLTAERKVELQEMARSTINAERTKITLRLPKRDIARLKSRAIQEGMPYQTLIGSILHKSVSS